MRCNRATLALGLVVGVCGLCGIARADSAAPAKLDCSTMPCGDLVPDATEFRRKFHRKAKARYLSGYDKNGNLVGWVAMSTDLVDVRAYSGKPLVTLVGLDLTGTISGALVIHHSEPILLVGIPETVLQEFASIYVGKQAIDRIVVGRATDASTLSVDAISGATVTALALNRTILETARQLGSSVGVVDLASVSPGRFVQGEAPWDFQTLMQRGALARLTVSQGEMGLAEGPQPFVDLFFGLADAPHVGRALMGERSYAHHMKQLQPGEHLFLIFGLGTSSFKGSAFVRGGIFDRVRLEQGLREVTFRDTDYYNLPDARAVGAPEFNEGAVFVVRKGQIDPGAPYDLVFLGSRYDHKTAYSREFREFKTTHQLPESVYVSERKPEGIWQQAWRNRALHVALLLAYLTFVVAVFSFRRFTTARLGTLRRLHLLSMVTGFLMVGVWMGAQPSVTQILTLADSVVHEWRWDLFASEPMLFVLWIFIAGVSVTWGRGVFCGWVCPYGAMTELMHKLALKVGIKPRELPDAVHFKLRYLRYLVLAALLPIYLWDSVTAEKLAEVEPFKSTFLVPFWNRHWLFGTWWLVLAGLSLWNYRPFCRYLCPLGAGLAVLNSARISGPYRRQFCSRCQICTRGCEPRAIRPDGSIDSRECLSCMECESNYRSDEVCPPLIGLEQIRLKTALTQGDKKRQLKLQQEARDL